jgi:transposase
MAVHSVSQVPAPVAPSQLERRWQQEFRQRWQAVAPAQWRCIGIDVGKYEHVAVAYDGLGQLLARPLRFGIRAADYQALFAWVATVVPDPAMTPLFGLEPTGHYYEQLVYELAQQYSPKQVYIVQTTDVARRRADWNQGTFKNDEVDAAIISQLLRQGHGRPYHPDEGAYLSLYQLERYRWAREQASTRLKNQIVGHVDRLYPGLVISDQAAAERYQPLFRNLWANDTPRRLLLLYPEPRDLRSTDVETLCQRFRTADYWMTRPYAAKILAAVCALPLPDAELAARRSTFLQQDLASLAYVEGQLAEVATEMVDLLDLTWGLWLRPTGVDPLRLVCLVATIGDLRQYHSARQLFGRSGLHSGCHDSGTRQQRGQGERMVKPGDRHLRRQLLRFTLSMVAHYPTLQTYRNQLLQRGKRKITANIAVARKLCGMLYTVASQERPFDPTRLA